MRKEMKTERFMELSHTRQRMIKEATGVDLITVIKGHKRTSAMWNLLLITARMIPAARERAKPSIILKNEKETAPQKSGSKTRLKSLPAVVTGEARRISFCRAIAPICHMAMANRTEAAFSIIILVLFIVEIIGRHSAAYRFGILVEQHLKVPVHGCFHFFTGGESDVAVGKGFFSNRSLYDIILFDELRGSVRIGVYIFR